MRGRLVLFALLVDACRPKTAPPEPAKSGPTARASVSAAATAPPPPPVRATSAAPMLAMRLDKDRIALYLEEQEAVHEKGERGDAGALTIYARDPMIAIGHPLDGAVLSAEARTHVEDAYVIHGSDEHTCEAKAEGLALVYRIPANDPTVSRDATESDDAWAARTFSTTSSSSRVVLVRSPGCTDVVWAAPKSQPQPVTLAVKPAPKAIAASTHAVIAKHEAYADVKNEKPTFEYSTVGDDLVWARAKASGYAGATVCFVVTREAQSSRARVVASTSICPPGAWAASRDAATTYVWFDNSVATVNGDAVAMTYFPTAYFGTAEE